MKYVETVVRAIRDSHAYRAVKYVSPKETVCATRRRYRYKGGTPKNPRKGEPLEIVLTIGRPNYVDRVFIRNCLAAGEHFPVKKVQLSFARGVA